MIRAKNRLAVQRQRAASQTQTRTIPAPVQGWNTRDKLANMNSLDATVMDNLFPERGYVSVRKGYESHSTGFPTDIETLADYHSSSTQKMLACSGSKIYTVPDAGGSPTEIADGFANARWQTQMHNDTMVLCNGGNTPQAYDGSTVSNTTVTGSGLTASNLVGCVNFKGRMIYWENASPDFWYAGSGSFQGTLTKFQLGQISRLGGNILRMDTWTRDGGAGPDDYLVIFMTSGEVLVYQGTDPGDASAWSLVGSYPLSPLLSIRGAAKRGGDIMLATYDDFDTLGRMIARLSDPDRIPPTRLTGAMLDAANYSKYTGWQVVIYPEGKKTFVNVPVTVSQTYHQYGVNSNTNAAYRFKGQPSRCWVVYKGELYFGGKQKVYKADTGLKDDGGAISVEVQQAYNTLGVSRRKRMTGFRPHIIADGSITINSSLSFDFGSETLQTITSEEVGPDWDTSSWDVTPWAPANQTRRNTYGAHGDGTYVGLRLKLSLTGQEFKWYGTDFLYQAESGF